MYYILAVLFALASCSHTPEKDDGIPTPEPTPTATPDGTPPDGGNLPKQNPIKSFSIQYGGKLVFRQRDYFETDGIDISASDILPFSSRGVKVIAYISSQFESWRKDAKDFPEEAILGNLKGWPGEKVIDTDHPKVREIMLKRIAMVKEKKFDLISFDNIDQGDNKAMQLRYAKWLCQVTHEAGLGFVMKNAIEMIPQMKDCADLFENESCSKYSECDEYENLGKPVFGISYSGCKPQPQMYVIYKDSLSDPDEEICE